MPGERAPPRPDRRGGRLPFERGAGRAGAAGTGVAASPSTAAAPTRPRSARWTRSPGLHLGELERLLEALRRDGVRGGLSGKVPKTPLSRISRRSIRTRGRRAAGALRDRNDDAILARSPTSCEREGIVLLSQATSCRSCWRAEGALGGVAPTEAQRADVAFAWPIAKAIGALDIGQTVVVRDRAVLALEAIEGTDAAIRRGGALGRGASAS